MAARRGLVPPACLIAGLVVVFILSAEGCATKKDTRYRNASLLTPLTIPEGLDVPAYSQAMDIPPAAPGAVEPPDKSADIEKPPVIKHNDDEK